MESKERTFAIAGLLNKCIKSNSEEECGFSGWIWAVLGFQEFCGRGGGCGFEINVGNSDLLAVLSSFSCIFV